jgi:protein BCP1
VKTDGRESDPLAFLTVLNVHVHRVCQSPHDIYHGLIVIHVILKDHPSIKAIFEYLLLKSAPNPTFHATLQSLVGPNSTSSNHVGLVFCERLINMPVQVIPPMYRMLADEIKWAIDDVCIHCLIYLLRPHSHKLVSVPRSISYGARRTNHTISPTYYSSPASTD